MPDLPLSGPDPLAALLDPASARPPVVVHPPKDRARRRAGSTDGHADLHPRHIERDASQHLEAAEPLVNVLGVEDETVGGHRAPRAQAPMGCQASATRSRNESSSPRSLTASFFSICAWISVHPVVNMRYQKETARKNSTGWKVVE